MKARSVGTFVQIGGMIINMALIVKGSIDENEVRLYFTPRVDGTKEEYPMILMGDWRLAFLDWWEAQAEQSLPPYNLTLHAGGCWVSSDRNDEPDEFQFPSVTAL